MKRVERIFRLHALLNERPRSLEALRQALDVSRATIVRDLGYLKDFMGAPLRYDRAANTHGYDPDAPAFELPGLWLNESELYALLAGEHLLEQIQPGLLAPYIGPLRARIRGLLAESGHSAAAITERIRLQPAAPRPGHPERFGTVAAALLERRRLRIRYHGRQRDLLSDRRVHPQRLLRYRDNWYLIAHCDSAAALRIFSLDRIRAADGLDGPALETPPADLDRFAGASFGIFSGTARAWAVLRFSAEASRWVADEHWHPEQIGHWDDGRWQLQVPYSDPRELLMDILKYGPDVEVLAPPELRERVAARLRDGAARYG
jgi:predicted DNA-binding transcriptional regulator YafY